MDFYGSLVDKHYGKSVQPKAPAAKEGAQKDLTRQQVRVPPESHAKKRRFDQISANPKSKYKKGDSDNEFASCHEDQSPDEDEGGSSQDKFEKDFIDDGREDAKKMRQK